MIYKFQPFSTSKNIGVEYNAHCAAVPNEDDWILILDYDAMILTPLTYQVVEAAIQRYPETTVFGAMTNRVGISQQRVGGMIDDNPNVRDHIKKAEELARLYPSECEPIKYVAGFFMLFRKSYWINNPFQEKIMDASGSLFDFQFCRKAMKAKLPIMLIKGAFIFHLYRMNKNYRDKSHLK